MRSGLKATRTNWAEIIHQGKKMRCHQEQKLDRYEKEGKQKIQETSDTHNKKLGK